MLRKPICCGRHETKSPSPDVPGDRKPCVAWSEEYTKPNKTKGFVFWMRRLFGFKQKKDKPSSQKKAAALSPKRNNVHPSPIKTPAPTPDVKTPAQERKEKTTVFKCCLPVLHNVHPSPIKTPSLTPDVKTPAQERKKDTMKFKGCLPVVKGAGECRGPQYHVSVQRRHQKENNLDLSHFGLENFGNSCYINVTVQSLMTIEPFMMNVSSQKNIWRWSREAGLFRHLHTIRESRIAPQKIHTAGLLRTIKTIVASKDPQFETTLQKDAHEFLTVLIGQIQSLRPILQEIALGLGTTYMCPVQELMLFNMDSTRTCLSCGEQSCQTEVFNHLSLTLDPGSTIDHLLQKYLNETELEYCCTKCAGQTSSLKSSFLTLPKVLTLHLKRFRYTPKLQLEKVNDEVHINRDLVVMSENDSGCFSLIGIISHCGKTADYGHYIFDGQDPTASLPETFDNWLSYSDCSVSKITGSESCRTRQKNAYILFYQTVKLN